MRWRNIEDLPPIPSDRGSLNQFFETEPGHDERNVLIYNRRRDGESYAGIAAEYGLSSTRVRAIIQDVAVAVRRFHEARRSV